MPDIPKYSVEDTTLVAGNLAGETTVIQVPAGANISIDTVGLHYNRKCISVQKTSLVAHRGRVARYWEDPFSFKPERFLGEWNRDAFIPFSGGARACIGRGWAICLQSQAIVISLSRFRFFETTGLAILTILIQHYKVEPHPKFAGEPFGRLKDRYSQGKAVLTLT